jgi:hypothetical protein
VRNVGHIWYRREIHISFVGRTEGKRKIGRPNADGNNYNIHLEKKGYDSVNWIFVGQDRNQG